LKDACLAYNLPLISGKDSMKNDARLGGKKISVRPTLLISLMGIVTDTRLSPSTGFVRAGDSIFVVGQTRPELSGSIVEHLIQNRAISELLHLGRAPTVELTEARSQYERFAHAIQHGLVASVHDLSDGGLAVALAESAFHHRLGCRIDISSIVDELKTNDPKNPALGLTALLGETPSRFLCSVPRDKEDEFVRVMDGNVLHWLGEVQNSDQLSICWNEQGSRFVSLGVEEALRVWKKGFGEQGSVQS